MPKINAKALARLESLLASRHALAQQIKDLEAEKKALDVTLLALAEDAGGTVETAHFTATVVNSKSSKLSKEKLTELGVRASIIAKATIETPYSYVKVTAKKEE